MLPSSSEGECLHVSRQAGKHVDRPTEVECSPGAMSDREKIANRGRAACKQAGSDESSGEDCSQAGQRVDSRTAEVACGLGAMSRRAKCSSV